MMRNAIGLFLVISSAAVALTSFAQQRRQTAPSVSVKLTTETPTVQLGAAVRVRAILTNQTSRPLSFNLSVQSNYRFEVSDDRGAVARRRRTGPADWRFGGDSLLGPEVPISPGIATLTAGASREEEITVSEIFRFDHVGTYRIRAIHPDPVSNEPVSSNPISIAVIP
jgi:hypothetical protein